MSMLEQIVRLDMKPQKNPPHVDCTQYDSGSDGWLIRAFLFNNGSKFVIPTGYTAKIEGTTKENTGFTFAATNIDNANGAVTFELTEDATAFKGSAWCKIVFEKGSSRIATSGFWLDNDRAGVEADTVIGADGFYNQIAAAVDAWLEENAQNGIPTAVKTALLNCFENVAWIGDDGQDYYDALHDALYQQVLDSISAVFTQGSAVIYDTDSLDTLKQYLVVTATYTDETTETLDDSDYTLLGTLAEGTSTITVSYGGKTDTFTVAVTHALVPVEYQAVEYIESTGTQRILIENAVTNLKTDGWSAEVTAQNTDSSASGGKGVLANYEGSNQWFGYWGTGINSSGGLSSLTKFTVNVSWGNDGITITQGDHTKTTAYSGSNNDFTKPNWCIFAMPSIGGGFNYYSKTKLWSLKMYKNGVLFRDFVPCYRKSDNVIGLYDTVTSTFYTNNGTGTFSKGDDI